MADKDTTATDHHQGAAKPVERKEVTLKEAILQGGVLRKAGERVKLRADQIERLIKGGQV